MARRAAQGRRGVSVGRTDPDPGGRTDPDRGGRTDPDRGGRTDPGPGRVRAGTSGYDYDPWQGRFYPAGLARAQRLGFYASQLSTLEINASFHRKPTPDSVRRWAAQVPETFRFAFKAWQRITHQKTLRVGGEPLRLFAEVLRPLGSKLGPILYQFPEERTKDVPLLRDFLAALPEGLTAAFEFRNHSWQDDEVHAALSEAGCALCVTDTDEQTTPFVRTAPFGYLRLRRTAYDAAALGQWAKRIAEAGFTGDVHAFFRHEDEARGPAFALELDRLVRELPLARAASRPPAGKAAR